MTLIDKFFNSSRSIWAILLIHFGIWLAVFSILDIHPDMADHWIWSRFLYFGYFEHPPVIALTMRLVTMFGGNTVIMLKIGSVLFSVLILFLAYLTGQTFFDRKTAIIFVLILESTPYFSTGSVFWHIDQPYMACWLLGLYAMGKYLKSDNPNWMLILGVFLGLGGMSKYIMILFPLGLLIWCLTNNMIMNLLTKWQTYVGAVISLGILAPNIYWNYQHDWVTFNFVLEKGLTGARFGEHFLHFIISQFALFSLVYSVYFWLSLIRKKIPHSVLFGSSDIGKKAWSFIFITGLVPMVVFTITSFAGSRTDPHWVNVSYFSFFLLLARYISILIDQGNLGRQVILFVSSTLLNLMLVILIILQIHFVIISINLPDAPSLKVLTGWDDTARQIEELYQHRGKPVPEFVISREYQLASALGLYLSHQPKPHSIEKAARNQWSSVKEVKKKGALVVCPPDECEKLLDNTEKRFKTSFKYMGEIKTHYYGKVIRKLKLFQMVP